MIRKNILLLCIFGFSWLFAVETDELTRKATDELSYLQRIQFIELASPENYRAVSSSNNARVRVVEILDWPFKTYLRQTFQVQTEPKSPATHFKKLTGLGDTQLLALVMMQEGSWGRWGIGPIMVVPTATRVSTGQGKWQLGPAFGIAILSVPNWQFELLAQNPITFAGSSNRSYVNQLIIQPIITRHFGHGWYAKSDAEGTVTWNEHAAALPVNLGIGRVFDMWGQKMSFTAYGQWTAYHRNTTTSKYTLKFELDLLFPD